MYVCVYGGGGIKRDGGTHVCKYAALAFYIHKYTYIQIKYLLFSYYFINLFISYLFINWFQYLCLLYLCNDL